MASATAGFRVDIQILRAVAVVLVLLYHFWPNIVRSGFIGVDVFFAISGFLITRHLMTDAATAGKFSVGRFWARRARRLLPAAFLVTFVTSLAVFAFQSQALWTAFIRQAVASTFYVENWVLAGDSVDYLASENAPTAVQQYWSLSVEEQFYLVWPILIIFALWLARKRTQQFEQYALVLLTLVSVASLVYSILRVSDGDASAYFSTLTRAWEFGFGGVVAIIGSRIGSLATALRRATTIAGWALLATAVILITPQSPFPGSLALLPIVGTCLIILGGQGTAQLETAAPKWLSPVLFAGAISYSLYLWHWPIIVLFPFVAGMAPNFAMKVALLALCVIVAWLTTRFVERPIQAQKWLVSGRLSKTLIIGLLAAGITVVPSGVAAAQLSVRLAADAQTRSEVVQNPCFGAVSGVSGATGVNGAVCADVQWPLLTPDPALAQSDVPTEANECKTDTLAITMCSFGDVRASQRIALIGDSHAGHWFPAIEQLATNNHLRLDIYLKSSCAFLDAPRSKDLQQCTDWTRALQSRLAAEPPYDLVMVNSLAENLYLDVSHGVLTADEATAGFQRTWEPFVKRGIPVVVIHDIPHMLEPPQNCLSLAGAGAGDRAGAGVGGGAGAGTRGAASCSLPRDQAFSSTDFEFAAGQGTPGVSTIDLTEIFCDDTVCFTAVGGAVIYSDSHHMTQTFSRSLTKPLTSALNASIGWDLH